MKHASLRSGIRKQPETSLITLGFQFTFFWLVVQPTPQLFNFEKKSFAHCYYSAGPFVCVCLWPSHVLTDSQWKYKSKNKQSHQNENRHHFGRNWSKKWHSKKQQWGKEWLSDQWESPHWVKALTFVWGKWSRSSSILRKGQSKKAPELLYLTQAWVRDTTEHSRVDRLNPQWSSGRKQLWIWWKAPRDQIQ